ncbi:MAG: carbohydrate kinase, partial [Lachnospiraceae bacterium]|nr:carbohydrate kinase [Lachnospiraceae bacterium]
MKKYLVGIDAGTMGCKTCIFDLDGKLISYDYKEYPIYFPADLTVEQDLDEVAEGFYATTKTAIEKAGIDPEEIIAVGLSTQGGCLTFVDADGKQIGRSISWMDNRCVLVDPDTSEYIDPDRYYELEGWS